MSDNTSPYSVSPTCIVHPLVRMSPPQFLGDFVIVGLPPVPSDSSCWETEIGPGAFIRSHTVIYAGNRIGARFWTGHSVLIRELNQIGDDVNIGSRSEIAHHVRLGSRVSIHSSVFIPEYSIIEDDTWIGPHAVLTNDLYPGSVKKVRRGPHVLASAKIGANATLLPGVVIGRSALVGAGAVVVRDVSDGKVVVGNPARVIKEVADLPAYIMERLLRQGE